MWLALYVEKFDSLKFYTSTGVEAQIKIVEEPFQFCSVFNDYDKALEWVEGKKDALVEIGCREVNTE